MKRKFAKIIPVFLAVSLMASSFLAYGASNADESGPGMPLDPETEARLTDDYLGYDEIEELVDNYSPTMKTLWTTYYDNKDSAKDVVKLKDSILSSAGNLTSSASDMRDVAASLENVMTYVSGGPASYASAVYAGEYLEIMGEQMTLMVDSMSEVSPEMLKVQLIDSGRASLIAGAQSAMIGYHQLLLSKETLENTIELLEAVYNSMQTQESIGMATNASVLSAKQSLDSAKAGLITIDIAEQSLKQTLCELLGWEYDADIVIGDIPEVDFSRIDKMDPNADKAAAEENNYTLIYDRLSFEKMTMGSAEYENMVRTIDSGIASIDAGLVNLYNDVLQKKSDYDTAVASLELEQVSMDAADRKWSVQTISRLEYLQEENAYKTAEINVKNAELALFQSMETYDWAVKGNYSF